MIHLFGVHISRDYYLLVPINAKRIYYTEVKHGLDARTRI